MLPTLGRRAAGKALASRNPQAIEPGMYTVVLEPQAVSDVLPLLTGSFNARNTDEGRSAFSKRRRNEARREDRRRARDGLLRSDRH